MRARSGQVYSTIFQFTPYFLIYISVFNSNFTIASLASWASPTKRKKGGYSNPPHINIILPSPYAYISSIMNNTTHPISIPTGNYSKRKLIKLPLLHPRHISHNKRSSKQLVNFPIKIGKEILTTDDSSGVANSSYHCTIGSSRNCARLRSL